MKTPQNDPVIKLAKKEISASTIDGNPTLVRTSKDGKQLMRKGGTVKKVSKTVVKRRK